jgi:hypothetical protein
LIAPPVWVALLERNMELETVGLAEPLRPIAAPLLAVEPFLKVRLVITVAPLSTPVRIRVLAVPSKPSAWVWPWMVTWAPVLIVKGALVQRPLASWSV